MGETQCSFVVSFLKKNLIRKKTTFSLPFLFLATHFYQLFLAFPEYVFLGMPHVFELNYVFSELSFCGERNVLAQSELEVTSTVKKKDIKANALCAAERKPKKFEKSKQLSCSSRWTKRLAILYSATHTIHSC